MALGKNELLQNAVADIQRRWGTHSVQLLSQTTKFNHRAYIPTGFTQLDTMLGGVPMGCITEFVGHASAGTTSVALSVIGECKEHIVYVEIVPAFDAHFAAKYFGVDLDNLLLVRPGSVEEGFEVAAELVSRYAIQLLVFDLALAEFDKDYFSTQVVSRLIKAVQKSNCAFLYLTSSKRWSDLGQGIAVRLKLERVRWKIRYSDVVGLQTRICVEKNKYGSSGQQAYIDIPLYF